MNKPLASTKIALIALALGGCGEDTTSGAGEPLRVYWGDARASAQFFAGKIPSTGDSPRTTDEAPVGRTGSEAYETPATVTQFEVPNQVVFPGQRSSKIKGRLSKNASAVALSFDSGSGYWVVPAGNPDSSSDDELMWLALCDYSQEIAPGYHELTVAPVNAVGDFGAPLTKKVCIAGRTPDHLNSCEPTLAPPKTVISLWWDSNVDLDLQVVPPSADRIVSPKRPFTVDRNEDGTLPDEAGIIDRDSNAGCSIDGIRYENLVFDKMKPDGVWGIYVNLFDSCKQTAVRFTASIHVAKSDGVDANDKPIYHLEQIGERHGMLLASDANGDSTAPGTYLFEVKF